MASDSSSTVPAVVSLHEVGKTYELWDDPLDRLTSLIRQGLGLGHSKAAKHFQAVRGVSLEIARGECLGIIGRNGAGKSTLLQMIAGTVRPTHGSLTVHGRVAALLELGSGFNPDFTGRENIEMNAAILGLSREEIAARYDSIVEYSGIASFIDQPVRTYSSGMTLRLAFAVCAHVDADIFIIDEALAVGDARFQFKCHATLERMLKEGRTIIFVSHDTNAVKRMCQSAVLLEGGEILLKGPPNEVTNIYTKLITSPHGVEAVRADIVALQQKLREGEAPRLIPPNASDLLAPALDGAAPGAPLLVEERAHRQVSDREYSYGGDKGQITSVLLCDDQNQPRLSFLTGDRIRVRLVCRALAPVLEPIYALTLKDVRGQEIYGTNTYFQNQTPPDVPAGSEVTVIFTLPLNVLSGVYFLSLGWVRLVNGEVEVVHRRYDVVRFDVLPRDRSFGLAWCPASIEVKPLPAS